MNKQTNQNTKQNKKYSGAEMLQDCVPRVMYRSNKTIWSYWISGTVQLLSEDSKINFEHLAKC